MFGSEPQALFEIKSDYMNTLLIRDTNKLEPNRHEIKGCLHTGRKILALERF